MPDTTAQAIPAQQPGQTEAKTVADILFAQNLLSRAQYDDIKVKSTSEGVPIEQVITRLGLVSEENLVKAKASLLGVPFIPIATTSFSPQALSLVSQPVAQRFHLIPFSYDEANKTLSVAMSDPTDLEAITFLQQKTGLTIRAFAAEPSMVTKSISQQYQQEIVIDVKQALKETEDIKQTKTINSKEISQLIKEAPIAKIVATILEYAVNSRSSDVHIEPQEDRVRVRYRIDGVLYDKLSLPKNVQEAVTSRIKILSELKIDEHRIPQDGRFNFVVEDKEVDLRISTIPTVHGEKIVMRLLRKSGGVPTIEELGIAGTAIRSLEAAILRPHGIIIVCGPTGSGKTTTLYAILSKLNTPKVNIMSLEDPVEYQIPGVNQIQINPAVGLTFATGLRAFLRQDPNIVLVGEIRDEETTALALQAALTGHLVFSTLHTSNAASVLPRLIDLGAETFLLASTINALVGQRIARRICTACKESFTPAPEVVVELQAVLGNLFPKNHKVVLYKGKGCSECGETGYRGRLGIYEVLSISDKIAKLVLERSDSNTIEKQAIMEGMITMKQDGYLKVLSGITTLEEVLRVAQE